MKKLTSKIVTKVIAIVLSMTMLVGLAGCGDQNTVSGDTPEYVYVPTYATLPKGSENGYTEVIQFTNDTLYYSVNEYDPEAGMYQNSYYSLDAKAEKIEPVKLDINTDGLELNNVMKTIITDDGGLMMLNATYKELGMVEMDGYSYMEYDYNNPVFELIKVDATGNVVFRNDMTQYMSNVSSEYGIYIQYMESDINGNVVLSDGEQVIWAFDKDGNFLFTAPVGSWLNGMGRSKDGDLYISFHDSTSGSVVLKKVDMQTKSLGEALKNLPMSFYDSPMPGLNEDFLLKASSDIYEYDIETQTSEKLLSLMDCDVQGDYADIIAPMSDGRIFVYYRDWSTNEEGVVVLTKTPSSEVVQKTAITLGCMGVSQSLQTSIIKFNKSSAEYRINIKDYAEELYNSSDITDWEQAYNDMITRMNNDILTGNSVDLLALDSSMNTQLFAAKGMFEDLNPYLEKSTKLNREDIVESVLKAYTMNDKLVAIPTSFAIETLVGPSSVVGDEMGWTMAEMLETAKNMPEGSKIMEEMSRTYLLQILLMGSLNDYINWETGECNFTSEEFLGVLELVKDYPAEMTYDEDAPSWPELVKENKIMLTNLSMYDTGNYLVTEEIFGGPITCIGFPNSSGSNGAIMQGTDAIALCAGSKNKEAAWAFLEEYISAPNERYSWNFPSLKSSLQAMMDEAMVPNYMYDENGEIQYDENGEPMQYDKGGYGWGNSNDIYYIYAATQEQVDNMMELINSTTTLMSYDTQLIAIIQEEAEPFFAGAKSAAECAEIIQGRIQLYVDETR